MGKRTGKIKEKRNPVKRSLCQVIAVILLNASGLSGSLRGNFGPISRCVNSPLKSFVSRDQASKKLFDGKSLYYQLIYNRLYSFSLGS